MPWRSMPMDVNSIEVASFERPNAWLLATAQHFQSVVRNVIRTDVNTVAKEMLSQLSDTSLDVTALVDRYIVHSLQMGRCYLESRHSVSRLQLRKHREMLEV
jgi:hypothetical protein